MSKLAEYYKNTTLYKAIDKAICKNYQKRLQNDNFSIICSNCIGGVIYHRLEKKFSSPTINLWMTNEDFIDFACNIEYYLTAPLEFCNTDEPNPVAFLRGTDILPSIQLHFTHYESEEEAKEKWEKRKCRVNTNNMYLIMCSDGISPDKVRRITNLPRNKYRNKALLTTYRVPEVEWSVYIKPNKRGTNSHNILSRNLFGIPRYERYFDFVKFLNAD